MNNDHAGVYMNDDTENTLSFHGDIGNRKGLAAYFVKEDVKQIMPLADASHFVFVFEEGVKEIKWLEEEEEFSKSSNLIGLGTT